MIKSVEIRIYGKVYNVGFRRYVHRYAVDNGVMGYVENERQTGSVHIVAEGDSESLERFVALCSHGTPYSIVTKVDVDEIEPRHYDSFEQIR